MYACVHKYHIYIYSLSQWTLKKKFELYVPYLICNPQKFKRLAIGQVSIYIYIICQAAT